MSNDEVCPCLDFDPIDGDPVTTECECGHVEDEHYLGFFRRCNIGRGLDD